MLDHVEEQDEDTIFIRLDKDLRAAAAKLSDRQARYFVDVYYGIQEFRKRSANQDLSADVEPTELIDWFMTNTRRLENQVKAALDKSSSTNPVGAWARSSSSVVAFVSPSTRCRRIRYATSNFHPCGSGVAVRFDHASIASTTPGPAARSPVESVMLAPMSAEVEVTWSAPE